MNRELSNPPVLDQAAFQQLLAAAYTLQEQSDHRPIKEAKADVPEVLSGTVDERVHLVRPASPMPQSQLIPQVEAPVVARRSRADSRNVCARIFQNNELFWRAATVAAIAAVLGLLLSVSINRLSPLPDGLAQPAEGVSRQLPFGRAKPSGSILQENGGANTKTIVMESPAETGAEPDEQAAVADQSPEMRVTPTPARSMLFKRKRLHSAYEDEGDVVAPDTVVHYGARSAAPRRAHKTP